MSPKEKALQLCQQFGLLGMKWEQTGYISLDLKNAKECAIICVDQLIDENEKHGFGYGYIKRKEWWQSVKSEIQAL